VKKLIVHGTLVKIMTRGVLILGDSGSGKSRLALSLLDDGGRLVSDDVVEIFHLEDGIFGRAPASRGIDGKGGAVREIKGLLEVRGIGIMDIGRVMGPSFVIEESRIDIVVRLGDEKGAMTGPVSDDDEVDICGNFHVNVGSVDLLGFELPEINLDSSIDTGRIGMVIKDFILGGSRKSVVLKRLLGNHG
jgi:hypothetical protein